MKKVIAIVGPTGIGKTKLSIELAKIFNGEIISGDSVQIYKMLDIGSAKVTSSEMQGVKHHLIDELHPTESYSVADFQRESRKLIDSIDIPIIAGGTGLYIKSALYDYNFSSKPRNTETLDKFIDYSNDELYDYLKKIDSKAAELNHMNNRNRVLRAIDYFEQNGHSITLNDSKHSAIYESLIILLDLERCKLYDIINSRVDKMLEVGLENEVKQLYDEGIEINAIGYKEFYPYFKKELTKDEVIENIKQNSRRLAKRQLTWFKNQESPIIINVDIENFEKVIEEAVKIVGDFLNG